MTTQGTRREEGGFIVTVLVLFVLLAVTMAVSARGTFHALLRDRPRAKADTAALYAAQGGVEKARVALAGDPSWTGGGIAVARATAAVAVRPVAGEPALREIVSVGTDPGGGSDSTRARRRIAAVVRLGGALPTVISWRED